MTFKLLLLSSVLFLTNAGFSQDSLSIALTLNRSIDTRHSFYIEKVVDKRMRVWTAEEKYINVTPATDKAFFDFYSQAIPRPDRAKGMTLFISDLKVANESGNEVLKLTIDFIYQNQFVFESSVSQNVSPDLERDLADLAVSAIAQFDVSKESDLLFMTRQPNEELERVKALSNSDDYELDMDSGEGDRNVSAVGYQIGGLTLIGFDYEFRVSDVFGPHIGMGLSGYTFGLKIHTGECKDSPFFNISYKDGGFGAINTIAMEYGGRLTGSRNKGGFGFHYQFGLGYLTNIDPDFQERLFGDEDPPPVLLSLGIGVSW